MTARNAEESADVTDIEIITSGTEVLDPAQQSLLDANHTGISPVKSGKYDESEDWNPLAGTTEQTEIIENYPTANLRDKVRVPYIERFNGNICVREGDYARAAAYYNKSLFALKCIFESQDEQLLNQADKAIQFVREIETPVSLNLALVYLKVGEYQHAIRYAGQVLQNEPQNSKALYRMGVAYNKIGKHEKAT